MPRGRVAGPQFDWGPQLFTRSPPSINPFVQSRCEAQWDEYHCARSKKSHHPNYGIEWAGPDSNHDEITTK